MGGIFPLIALGGAASSNSSHTNCTTNACKHASWIIPVIFLAPLGLCAIIVSCYFLFGWWTNRRYRKSEFGSGVGPTHGVVQSWMMENAGPRTYRRPIEDKMGSETYVPEYTKVVNRNDRGYFDEQGIFHTRSEVSSLMSKSPPSFQSQASIGNNSEETNVSHPAPALSLIHI